MFGNIRSRTTTLFIVLVVLTETIVGLVGLYRASRYFTKEFDDNISSVFTEDMKNELTAAANELSQTQEDSGGIVMSETGPDPANNIYDIVMRHSSKLGINKSAVLCILDNSGAVLASSETTNVTEAAPSITAALGGTETSDKDNREYVDYALPLKAGDSVRYVVYIKDTMAVKRAVVSRLAATLAVTVPISAALGYLAALLLAASVTTPLKQLSSQARRLANGDGTITAKDYSLDEISTLSDSIVYLSESKKENADRATAEMTKIEKILENMNDGILAFDIKGKLTHINPEAMRLLKRNFVDDITFNNFFKEVDVDITLEALLFSPTDSTEREIRLNNQILQLNIAVFSRDSSEGGVIVIIHDVTKHERLERSRRDFVADVSHELRTPLTVIKSYADILADTPDAESEVRTRFLNTISSETDRMAKIISDLLTLSKLDENTNYTRPIDDIDVRAMLEGMVERLSLTAKKKDQTLSYTPINEVPKIKGDRGGLERVFANIITNALKYTPSGGEINVFSSKIYNDIVVKISDNGIGIPKDQLPNIFDRFYRVDKARSRDKGGTGLGLAIAKETIETAFNGKILITSELNKGTDVTVSIPLQKK